MAYQCKILNDEAIRVIDEIVASGGAAKAFISKSGLQIVEVHQKPVYKSCKKPVDKKSGT